MIYNNNLWNRIRYTLYSPVYDLAGKVFGSQRRISIGLLDPKPGERVLIIGAGTGLDLNYLDPNLRITAIDITPAMVNRIRCRAGKLGMNIDALVMDGQKLEFPDASFDCVIMHLILAVIPDPYKCIKEAERVLVPGGRAVIFDKFIPDSREPSFFRQMINVFTGLFFSEINRSVARILKYTEFTKETDTEAGLGGLLRIIKIVKPYQ